MPLSAHYVIMRDGVVLNPHYKNMGLYGSEYWTYLLPRRVGERKAKELTNACLPVGSRQALKLGMVDYVFTGNRKNFYEMVQQFCRRISVDQKFSCELKRLSDERRKENNKKSLEEYRKDELKIMHKNIFENNWSFEEKRKAFVYKL